VGRPTPLGPARHRHWLPRRRRHRGPAQPRPSTSPSALSAGCGYPCG
jgi:hypothetical protein